MAEQENDRERVARLALEENLEGDEKLLAFSKGSIQSLGSEQYVGLTDQRFILMPLRRGKPSGDVHSIWRDRVDEPKWTTGVARFKLPKDNLLLNFGSRWRIRGRFWLNRAKAMADLTGEQTFVTAPEDAGLAQRQLQQARDYQKIGFPASAQVELETALQTDPNLRMDPALKSFREQLAEERLASKVGGSFFLVRVAADWLLLLLLLLIAGSQILGEVIDAGVLLAWGFSLWAGVRLWQGHTSWRRWGIFVAALGLFAFGLLFLLNGQFIDLLIQAAFSGSIILVLTGTSNRTRTWIATGIYIIGYLGITFLQLLGQFFGSL